MVLAEWPVIGVGKIGLSSPNAPTGVGRSKFQVSVHKVIPIGINLQTKPVIMFHENLSVKMLMASVRWRSSSLMRNTIENILCARFFSQVMQDIMHAVYPIINFLSHYVEK